MMPIESRTVAPCCAETVNSAVSLWTELEILDEDEDQYTYMTLDTASEQFQLQQQKQQLRLARQDQRAAPVRRDTSPPRGGGGDAAAASTADDSDLWRQEDAYWRSFRSAVKSFSDRAAIVGGSSNYTLSMSYDEEGEEEEEEKDETDTDVIMMSLPNHLTLRTGSSHDFHGYDDEEDDLPPCLPRTIVTPTASIGSSSGGGRGGTGCGTGGSMSVASLSSSSSHLRGRSPPQEMMAVARHSASTAKRSSARTAGSDRAGTIPPPAQPSGSPGGGDATEGGQYAAIRRSLKALTAQAAINKRAEQPLPPPPRSPVAAAAIRRKQQRGDPDFAISASLAGPSLEEIKDWRWRMKELAEHAAVVAKGDQGAERLLIGVAHDASSLPAPSFPYSY